ncbi:hypothetical protein B0I35DRAFT_42361 [Stachybotrys elegans]|uniref:G-patch domain-containing protein n=1 Tax=Stachybotrys elegans TaxID=80388 RepID=A0A8K0T075_9HYPO|nr:hypothetical protein B0I35DRAFT_42361 [Stachybotrys elegans]
MSATSSDKRQGGGEEEEDDDYMNMTFDEPASAKETSLQRTQRLKRESRARGVVKSKAQLAEEEAAAREKALSTSILDDPRAKKSKGLAMMAKMGFAGGGLGKKAAGGEAPGRTEPIRVEVKEDRSGIGLDSERKRKLREEAEARGVSKAVKLDPDEYRERVRREREEARLEKQFFAAQRMAERLDDEQADPTADKSRALPSSLSSPAEDESPPPDNKPRPISSRPLKSLPVLYRGLVRHREEKERDRRMRYDLEQSLSRLPTYEDDEDDEDDKLAKGKKAITYVVAEDLDEEDEELEAFDALEISERLRQAIVFLRERHRYCFWCKMAYPDEQMEGCPGLTEEDHD